MLRTADVHPLETPFPATALACQPSSSLSKEARTCRVPFARLAIRMPVAHRGSRADHRNTGILENVPRIATSRRSSILCEPRCQLRLDGQQHVARTCARSYLGDLDPQMCARIARQFARRAAAGSVRACDLSPPGGDVIGPPRLDTHFTFLAHSGRSTSSASASRSNTWSCRRGILRDEPSVTATEECARRRGHGERHHSCCNAASEQHVKDLASFWCRWARSSTASVRMCTRAWGNAAPWHHAHYWRDHIEVGSFHRARSGHALGVRIAGAGVAHLRSTLMGFERLGIRCIIDGDELIVPANVARHPE